MLATASGPELGELMGLADEVAAGASAVRVAVAVEAVRRGECAGGEAHGWVREHAPSLRQGGAASVARLAVDVAGTRSGLGVVAPHPESPVGIVWSTVASGSLDASTATSVLREVARVEPLLREEAVPTVTTALVDLAREWGPSVMRRLRPRLLADHGHHGALDDLQGRLAAAARLSMPHVESADLTEYQLWMTPEQAAILEAAIGPLSAPAPAEDTGEKDLRPAGQRRVEALAQVCRASSASSAATDTASAATLHVTIPLAHLTASTGAGEVLGSVATGTLLAPESVRRLSCDAALVPHVLGTRSEPLTVGRVARLFTRAQRRHLWLRDRACTWPGCTAPAAWAEAHHVRHWADGGPTDISNAALLCARHHATVHRRRLTATIRTTPDDHGRYVVWDLTNGSYERALEESPPPTPPPDNGDDPDPWRAARTVPAA